MTATDDFENRARDAADIYASEVSESECLNLRAAFNIGAIWAREFCHKNHPEIMTRPEPKPAGDWDKQKHEACVMHSEHSHLFSSYESYAKGADFGFAKGYAAAKAEK